MHIHGPRPLALAALVAAASSLPAQQPKPEDTEVWGPVPIVVTPGTTNAAPPSDAIVLFDGRNLDEWQSARDKSPARWTVSDGVVTVNKAAGDIETRRTFRDYQLHVEWRIPTNVTGSSQERGNSGVFLAIVRDGVYELQIVDSYNNSTYVNGMAGSLYKQSIPLVNASRKPGEWQTYDVVWTAPTFEADGTLRSPAYATVFYNGLLVANHFAMLGETRNTGLPSYTPYTRAPIALQAHGDPSPPISFRNIWIRELAGP
jgi:Domain of Unknown Function (DUF1080)